VGRADAWRSRGPVTGYEQAEAWDRARVRGYFGVEEGRRLVYVAAGGGGDGRDALEALVRAVAGDERNVVLAGYGPLHRGGCVYAKNVIPLLEGNVSRIFGGVDAAVSAAGFNSYEELLAARVPTLFFAQDKGLDRQDLRIERGLAGSLHGVIPERADPELVRGRLDDLLEGELGARVREALSARPAPDGALRAAVELLGVCAGLEGSSLDRGVLHELAACAATRLAACRSRSRGRRAPTVRSVRSRGQPPRSRSRVRPTRRRGGRAPREARRPCALAQRSPRCESAPSSTKPGGGR
jgi:hypothetical protein